MADAIRVSTTYGGLVQRLFPGFPAGFPGSGLLILRCGLGLHLAEVGRSLIFAIHAGDSPAVWTRTLGAWWMLAALLIIVGVLTPFVQVALASSLIIALTVRPELLHASVPLLQTSNLGFDLLIAFSLALLGPGAFSVDAYRFGRRTIRIPPPPRQTASRLD